MEAEELEILVQTESGGFRPRERDFLVSMGSCGCGGFAQGNGENISNCFMILWMLKVLVFKGT